MQWHRVGMGMGKIKKKKTTTKWEKMEYDVKEKPNGKKQMKETC